VREVSSDRVAILIAFVRLGRPHFLVGGFVLYGLGAAIAIAGGAVFNLNAYLLGQAAITAIQLMTHYANDYFDLAADRANATPTRWSGGSRVLSSGTLRPGVALRAALVLASVGLTLTGAVAWRGGEGGPAAAAALMLALILAWFYSAPPLVLHSRGLGEATTAVVVTGLTPLVGNILQNGGCPPTMSALALCGATLLPVVGLQFAMLLSIEFPDAVGDAAVGKRTLVVRLGTPAAVALYRAILVAVFGALPVMMAIGVLPAPVALGAATAFPIAAWQFVRLGRGAAADARRWEGLAFRSVATLFVVAGGELLGFLYLAIRR
jgi:1,4-dihydroxy-2-naphthoate octaprenyltransferase